ncbi:tetratricopeptide repeat protein [Saccharothrix sp. HUAS TT1]|uniref:ATP-binding protein n=1 Tax=unclassified Saccharothrix TaxID=2593673 RepID=UPI00345BDC3E
MVAGQAVHRTIVLVDVEGFGERRRTLPHQVATRAGVYRALVGALREAGVPWEACHHEDRGDGVVVLVPPEYAKASVVEVVPAALVRALLRHNGAGPPEQRIRLRVVVHAGEVTFDDHGVTSTALTTAFRLLDAPALKQELADSPGVLALMVSRWIFDEVVLHSTAVDPTTFRPAPVVVKEVHDTAWTARPDHPHPADPSVLRRPAPGGPAAVPRQLPAPPIPFVGREDELQRLDAVLRDVSGTAVISAVGGAGGIGKTWLALHWAHRNAHRFPDGQLFVDLRGFSPDSAPMDPTAAIRGFLDALGLEHGRIPVDPHAMAALFRSLVADRRMLFVLDNAVDTAQVTPLLPGGQACTVLVTSRERLSGLITRHAAHHLPLDVLTDAEARALLTGRLGATRVDGDPSAVDALVELCGGFPLAAAIIAGRAGADHRSPLGAIAEELRELGVEALDSDDPGASLATVLSWSLHGLTTEQRDVFALLGIAPGSTIGLPAAASLTDLTVARTRRVLQRLAEASLLEGQGYGRYSMHDLIRDYAATTAHQGPTGPAREQALHRVVDFYLHTTHAADRLLEPHEPTTPLDPPAMGVRPHPLPDVGAALTWLDTEHTNVLAAQQAAVALERHHAVWQFAMSLKNFHIWRGHLNDAFTAWQAALDAAAHLPAPVTLIRAHRLLGNAHSRLGRHEQAAGHLRQALTLAEQNHDDAEQAHVHRLLALAHARRGDHRRALLHAERTLALYRPLGRPAWEAAALALVGSCASAVGDHDAARDHCRAALALHRRLGNLEGEATALDGLASIDHRVGRHHQAVERHRQALALFRELGNTGVAADVLDRLARPHAALGQHAQARAAWEEALELYRRQGRGTDVERVRGRLAKLDDRALLG